MPADRSPIEQELIHGKCYWEPIGSGQFIWFRLVEHRSLDVIGHYKREWSLVLYDWIAVCHGRNHLVTGKTQSHGFNTDTEARRWIEDHYRAMLDKEAGI